MKTFKYTIGRMFNKDYSKCGTIKAVGKETAISKLAKLSKRGTLPNDATLKSIREVK
jgi:hypothetical protein